MFFDCIHVSAGEWPYQVWAQATLTGKDINVAVGGGTCPHIGAVSLAVYEPLRDSATVSTTTVFSHRDDAVASFFAKAISLKIKCTVSVSAGIHVDDANEKDIEILRGNAEICCNKLIEEMKAAEGV